MSDNGHRNLNLDELFGIDRPIVVKWHGNNYELRRPESLTPKEYVRWRKLTEKLEMAKNMLGRISDQGPETLQENEAAELEQMTDEVIGLLNSGLNSVGLSFMAKSSVLQFYTSEVMAQEGQQDTTPKK